MEIPEIKTQLSIASVLAHYNLKPSANNMLCCPFHADKTPSMQVYVATNTVYCFSSNCKLHGKAIDVIDFILHKDNLNKHDALLKATSLIAPTSTSMLLPRAQFLERMFGYFKNAVPNSPQGKAYLEARGLRHGALAVGYNAGIFHHGTKKVATLITSALQYGLLIDAGLTSKTGDKAYKVFGKNCIVFAMRNASNEVTGLYFRSTLTASKDITPAGAPRHFYLKESTGLYPHYPPARTVKLILTESIIDAATLLQISNIASNYSILACYGTNRLTEEIMQAIQNWSLSEVESKEIIFAFDNDDAGCKATEKYANELKMINENLKISTLVLPNKDINETFLNHNEDVFTHLLDTRKTLHGNNTNALNTISNNIQQETQASSSQVLQGTSYNIPPIPQLTADVSNGNKLVFESDSLIITVWGGIALDNLSRLKVSVHLLLKGNDSKQFRDDVNLYSHSSTQKLIIQSAETLGVSTTLITATISALVSNLETYRLAQHAQQHKALAPKLYEMTSAEKQAAQAFLSAPNLVQRTLDTLANTGLIGETRNGLLLYFLYLSRFFDEPLHAIIFGKSGSGKTYLQTKISECLPEESLRTTTSLSENTLYYSPKYFWQHIVLLIEDLDGVYNALLPLREFMSKQSITKLTTDKDAKGNNVQKVLTVEGPICVSGATTKENIYEDNANRSFLIYVDETASHLNEVMEYQRRAASGNINKQAQEEAKKILRNAQRLITKNITIINPYAQQLRIPEGVFKKLRTNIHYLKLIEIITFYHQGQRTIYTNNNGERFINTTLEDIHWANYLVKDVLLKKSDELNGELRTFFENLKALVTIDKEKGVSFFSKDIRERYRMHPMKVNRYLHDLELRGYVQRTGGNRKSGFEFEISNWHEYQALQEGVNSLDVILKTLQEQENQQRVITKKVSVT